MPITTDTQAMRNTLIRLNNDALDSMNNDGECTIKVADLSTLMAAYKIELNKNRGLKKTLAASEQS
ncbi:hypothetical protein [Enterovibrio coralii]|uniref:Uncharacterized protein n=1 Tax=Enterovibrio coralii TaxID=294935 RepID=A0A135IAY9_9GAMM|nr:hypothetical protein [Enterovibrio coralii]KXF82595.1 hypothetical protein ATN88_21230 [Enterovibrio coralii]